MQPIVSSSMRSAVEMITGMDILQIHMLLRLMQLQLNTGITNI